MSKTHKTLHLLRKGWTTALQSAVQGGCLSLSQRVGEFEREGYTIKRKWIQNGRARFLAYRCVGRIG